MTRAHVHTPRCDCLTCQPRQAHFDRFDVCEAWYCFASEWHAGQRSKQYQILGRLNRIRFRPRPNLSFSSLSENGQAIYAKLLATV